MLRGALIGCGFFAQNHMHGWAGISNVEIVALCDANRKSLDDTAAAFSVENTYLDAAQMLKSEKLDFVDIATTVGSHKVLVQLAATAGVHVICQKPFAENIEDARTMVQAVKAAGKTLMVHENFRWQSAIRKAIDLVRSGEIGEPFFGRISFRSGYDVYSGQPYLATDERFIIQDLGIHILDISRALFGDVSHIVASTKRVNQKIVGEDVATMMLTHLGGVTSFVDCSYATRRVPETFPETLLEIDGEAGTLRLDAGYQLTIQKTGDSKTVDGAPPLLPWASKPWHNIQESVQIIQQHFVDCIAENTQPETSGLDNLQTLSLVEAAYISAAQNRVVALKEL